MYNQKEKAERIGKFFRFEDLRIYHKSIDYNAWVLDAVLQFPSSDQSQFVLRFCDSARNISFFIAEGSSRNKPQFIQYLKMAKTSIRECLIFGTLALKQNNITETQEEESRQQLMEMTKMIGALISSLQRSSGGNGNHKSSNNGNFHYNGKSDEDDLIHNKLDDITIEPYKNFYED